MTNFTTELAAKMACRSGVVHIVEEDEARLRTKCQQTAASQGYSCWVWTQTDGLRPVSDDIKLDQAELQKLAALVDPVGNPANPGLLSTVKNWDKGPAVILAIDLLTFVNRLPTLPIASRLIKDITEQMKAQQDDGLVQLVLCDAEMPQLATPLQRMQMELPDRTEMAMIVDLILNALPDEFEDAVQAARDQMDRILNSLAGLPAYQASNALSESLSRTGRIDPSLLKEHKKELVAAKGITWIDTDDQGFGALGGLTPLKEWLKRRAAVMMDDELRAEYGVGMPKGVVCAGIPGAGKSFASRCLASFLGVPLLSVDIGATRAVFQGQSEQNWRDVLATVESVPCVMLLDEAEKQLGGTTGQGTQTDGGTGSRVLGAFLTWMQENKTAKTFVYMTANRPTDLPPELLRAGRLSGQFWFDLPTKTERAAIINVMNKRYPKAGSVDCGQILEASDGTTGAEIETAYEEAAILAMAEKRDMTTEDVVAELGKVTKVRDTFQTTDEMERWKQAAQRANDVDDTPTSAPSANIRRISRMQ